MATCWTGMAPTGRISPSPPSRSDRNFQSIEAEAPEAILMLSGDHIYKMNYGDMLDWHGANGADITIATLQVPPAEAGRYGILEISSDFRVTGFEEKPQH